MFDINKAGPTPDDLGVRHEFTNVHIPLTRLFEQVIAAGKYQALDGLQFTDCIIRGPSVVIADADTRFDRCNLGNVHGAIENLFLRATGPGIIGAIPLNGCVFESCLFLGVGFAGNQNYIDSMIRELRAAKGAPS